MQYDQIRALIGEAAHLEQQTGMLRRAVVDLARLNGRSLSGPQAQGVIDFVGEYIEHAPALMWLIKEAAAKEGALGEVQPILDATEDYFLAEDDVIPDHLGMIGLVDDAYLTHTLMQAISDRHMSQSGKSVLPVESHEINAFIRRLIGEPFVSILDEHVSATLNRPSVQNKFDQLLAAMGSLNLSVLPDPIWGDAQTADFAGMRLMATGVFVTAKFG
jgi:hypothetical protein